MSELTKDDLRKLDYEKTLEFVNQLSDIRFKLLALVPIATGSAVGLTDPDKYSLPGLFLGILGFFVTLGIIFYDQRNTEIYDKEMKRARLLELRLNIPSTSEGDIAGGPVGGRSARGRKLFGSILM